jgi:hypothetical protein
MFLKERYFRVETFGAQHIPGDGRFLLIGNHSGQLPFDAAMVGTTVLADAPKPRIVRGMVERWSADLPFVSELFVRAGQIVGDPTSCARLLNAEEAVLVFPEGARGINKLFNQRYQLGDFGHGFPVVCRLIGLVAGGLDNAARAHQVLLEAAEFAEQDLKLDEIGLIGRLGRHDNAEEFGAVVQGPEAVGMAGASCDAAKEAFLRGPRLPLFVGRVPDGCLNGYINDECRKDDPQNRGPRDLCDTFHD